MGGSGERDLVQRTAGAASRSASRAAFAALEDLLGVACEAKHDPGVITTVAAVVMQVTIC